MPIPTPRFLGLLIVLTMAFCATPALAQDAVPACRPLSGPLPVVIAEEGRYCLTSSLTLTTHQGIAIRIAADNVTLDLNGFMPRGLGDREMTTALGIFSDGVQNVTVRNGTVRGFYGGINSFAQNTTVENMLVDRNTFTGIVIANAGAVVRNNRVVETGGTRIVPQITPFGKGIQVSGPSPRILDNDVTGFPGEPSSRTIGILAMGGGGLVVNNRIVSVERGIQFGDLAPGTGKYRDNLMFDVATPYSGGIDAGNNN